MAAAEVIPVVTASIPRWVNPVDDDLRRRARRVLACVERARATRNVNQLTFEGVRIDNRVRSPEVRALRHRIIASLNAVGFTDTEIGRLLGMDRRSVAWNLDKPARRTA